MIARYIVVELINLYRSSIDYNRIDIRYLERAYKIVHNVNVLTYSCILIQFFFHIVTVV